jgi:transposase
VPCPERFDRKLAVDGELGCISTMEVVMRPPEVFVRELSPDEGNRLKRLSKTAKSEVKRQRALICWASATRMSVPVIARLVDSDESHVRKVIHAFNERGFQSLDPEWRGGRPRRITDTERERIVAVAGARPDSMGVALTRWSLRRLSCYLQGQEGIAVSPSHLADYLDWDAANWALARHVQHRNGPHRDHRITELERRHRIAA